MFAPDYPRNGQGHIIFPTDTTLRRELFLQKVEHPSKNNLHIYEALYYHLMKPGQIVLDPMAGAGSCMWLARHGLDVYLIEIEDAFQQLLQANRKGFTGNIKIFEADCRAILPFPAMIDHIVFSPPYSNQIKANKGMPMYEDEQRSIAQGIRDFVTHKDNLSKMPDFYFNMAMKDVYSKCFISVKPGGTMTFIIKDHIVKGGRVRVTEFHVRLAAQAGFELYEWHKREAIGSLFGHWNKQRGAGAVEDEDIVIMRKT